MSRVASRRCAARRNLRTQVSRPMTALALLVSMVPGTAPAETSSTFLVSATLAPGCAVDGLGMQGDAGSFGQLAFGEGMALATTVHSASLTADQTLVLRCTPGTSLTMSINGGQHLAGGVRHLQVGSDPAERLQYRLYRDAGFTQEIGIDQPQSISIAPGNMNDVRLSVHGRLTLPGGRTPGVYSDTLVVTLDW